MSSRINYNDLGNTAKLYYNMYLAGEESEERKTDTGETIKKSISEKITDLKAAKKALGAHLKNKIKNNEEYIALSNQLAVLSSQDKEDTPEYTEIQSKIDTLYSKLYPDYKDAFDAMAWDIYDYEQELKNSQKPKDNHITSIDLKTRENLDNVEKYRDLIQKRNNIEEEIKNSYVAEDGSVLSQVNQDATNFLERLFSTVDKYYENISNLTDKMTIKNSDFTIDDQVQNIIDTGIADAEKNIFKSLKNKLNKDKPVTEKDLVDFERVLAENLPNGFIGNAEDFRAALDTKLKKFKIKNKLKIACDNILKKCEEYRSNGKEINSNLLKKEEEVKQKYSQISEDVDDLKNETNRLLKYSGKYINLINLRDALRDLVYTPSVKELVNEVKTSTKDKAEVRKEILNLLNDEKFSKPLAVERVNKLLERSEIEDDLNNSEVEYTSIKRGEKVKDRTERSNIDDINDKSELTEWKILFENGLHPDLMGENFPIRMDLGNDKIVCYLSGVANNGEALITPLYIRRYVTNNDILNFVDRLNEQEFDIKKLSEIWNNEDNANWREEFFAKNPERQLELENPEETIQTLENTVKARFPKWKEIAEPILRPYLNMLSANKGDKYKEEVEIKKIYKDFKKIFVPHYSSITTLQNLTKSNLGLYVEWLQSRLNKNLDESLDESVLDETSALMELNYADHGIRFSTSTAKYYAAGRVKVLLYRAGVSENACIIPFTYRSSKWIITDVSYTFGKEANGYAIMRPITDDGKIITKGENLPTIRVPDGGTVTGEIIHSPEALNNILQKSPEAKNFIYDMPISIWEASKTPNSWHNLRKVDKRGEYIDLKDEYIIDALEDYENENKSSIKTKELVAEYQESIVNNGAINGTRPISARLKKAMMAIADEAHVTLRLKKDASGEKRYIYQIFSPYDGYSQADKPHTNSRFSYSKASKIIG